MSKTTLLIIAGASAAAGASLTALVYGSKSKQSTPIPSAPASRPHLPSSNSSVSAFPSSSSTVPASVASLVDPNGLFQYGFPGPVSDLRSGFSLTSSFNRSTRNPHWVAEHITPQSLSISNGDRRHSYFTEDASVPALFRAKLTDYLHSGFDRGHQVPAADAKWSQRAMDDTFLLTNMCPQVGDGFNRDYWAHFEDFCRKLTTKYPSVRIVTGPLYLPKRDPVDGKWRVNYEVIGNPPNIAVPTHFYKVIYGETSPNLGENPTAQVALGAFVLPNAPIANEKSLSDFEVPVEAVERASGLEFASKLPKERRKRLCAENRCEIMVREFNKERPRLIEGGQNKSGSLAPYNQQGRSR
ncbi:MAG: hypothetical protein Q9227_008173 [Pyrenula ochraceoflavens]